MGLGLITIAIDLLFAHNLFGKRCPNFPGHALATGPKGVLQWRSETETLLITGLAGLREAQGRGAHCPRPRRLLSSLRPAARSRRRRRSNIVRAGLRLLPPRSRFGTPSISA